VRDRDLRDVHFQQVLLGGLNAFSNRRGNFARLAGTVTDDARAIAHHDQRRKAQVLSPFNHFSNPVN
jgi:hypothetical protein